MLACLASKSQKPPITRTCISKKKLQLCYSTIPNMWWYYSTIPNLGYCFLFQIFALSLSSVSILLSHYPQQSKLLFLTSLFSSQWWVFSGMGVCSAWVRWWCGSRVWRCELGCGSGDVDVSHGEVMRGNVGCGKVGFSKVMRGELGCGEMSGLWFWVGSNGV